MPQNDRPLRVAARGARHALTLAVCLLAIGAAGASAQDGTGGTTPGATDAPAPAPTTSKSTDLSRGDIRAAQRKLGVKADGRLGPQTRRAIRRFQKRNDIKVDGRLGPATLEALGIEPAADEPAGPTASGAVSEDVAAHLERIAECESGGDPKAVSPDGQYRGKYQFLRSTWEAVGGTGDPAEAPEAEQDQRAAALYEKQGPGAWPVCSKQ